MSEFVVTESNGRWHLRASPRRVMRLATMLLIGGVLMIGGGIWMDFRAADDPQAWWRDSRLFATMGCLTAFLLWGCGLWAFWIRNVPLSVDTKTGAVQFGRKQICAPGAVKSVLFRRDSNPEELEPYFFEFRLMDGTIVSVPSPSFARIGDLAHTSALVEQLGAKLKVKVERDF